MTEKFNCVCLFIPSFSKEKSTSPLKQQFSKVLVCFGLLYTVKYYWVSLKAFFFCELVCKLLLLFSSNSIVFNSIDPMGCRLPEPSSSSLHGIFQAGILEWVAISLSRESSRPRDWIHVSCIAGGFFTTEPLGKPTL